MSRRNFPPGTERTLFGVVGALLILVLLVFFLLPFGKARSFKAEVLILGHAGSGFLSPLNPFNPLPANSMASIVKALEEHGADGVEVDVQLTKDGVFVLYHDVTLESITDGTGLIEEQKAADVVGLEYKGGFFYELFHDESIITLRQMLDYFATYPELPYLHLDLRNHNPERHLFYAQNLLEVLREYNYPLDKLAFISPNADLLEVFRQFEPEATLLVDAGGEFEPTLEIVLARSFHGICANGKSVSEEQVRHAKEKGLQVVLVGGKSQSTIADMISLKPHTVQVNNVEAARKLVE